MRIVAPHLGKLCRWSDRFIYKSEKFINEFSWSVIQQTVTDTLQIPAKLLSKDK